MNTKMPHLIIQRNFFDINNNFKEKYKSFKYLNISIESRKLRKEIMDITNYSIEPQMKKLEEWLEMRNMGKNFCEERYEK